MSYDFEERRHQNALERMDREYERARREIDRRHAYSFDKSHRDDLKELEERFEAMRESAKVEHSRRVREERVYKELGESISSLIEAFTERRKPWYQRMLG